MRALPAAGVLALALGIAGCGEVSERRPRMAVFVGVDVSGSFQKGPYFQEALEFLAHYIYAHLNGRGNLQPLKALYVGTIGGEEKSFRPIHDFEGKNVEQIGADLAAWFAQPDQATDFNLFFNQVADIAQKRNLSLSPIEVLLLSDGVPAYAGAKGKVVVGRYDKIDLSPLDYLSRKVTVRMLYLEPTTASRWDSSIERKRVRLWTVDQNVMSGWKGQLDGDAPDERQERLWKWIADNVDYRVRPSRARPRRARA
ncbi:MAG: hypothetical protein HY549_08335 [Elusimicrobia bacterium]|nr:hypothetical protein [Elusimicrobiota bacterium]